MRFSERIISNLNENELIGFTLRTISPLKLGWVVVLLLLITCLAIPCQMSIWIIKISEGHIDLIHWYLGLQIIEPLLNTCIVLNLRSGLANLARKKFIRNALLRYNSMTYLSKNKISITLFNENMQRAQWATYLVIDWGLPIILHLIGSLMGALLTFYEKNLITEFILTSGLIFFFHNFVIKPKQSTFTEIDKAARKIRNHISAKIQLFLIPFQYKELGPDDICEMHNQTIQQDHNLTSQWNQIMGFASMGNKFVGALITYVSISDPSLQGIQVVATFMLMTRVVSQLSSSVSDATQFTNQWNKHLNDWATFQEMMHDAEFSQDHEKLRIPKNLRIRNVTVTKGTFKLTADPKVIGLNIGQKQKILITGKTNGGKTTLMEALTGKIQGIELNQGVPENYHHLVADMFQTIREKFPSSKVTIRNFFKDEKNDQLIERCLRVTFCTPGAYDDFVRPFKESKESKDQNPYDVELSEALSGGQKTRLCLATRVYEMIKYKKQILILDEPEQGLDTDTKIAVIKNLFQEFADKTIFMISHLCECEHKMLGIRWNAHLHVVDGVIHRTM